MTFPFFEVTAYETGGVVSIAVQHVRSVRSIRDAELDDDTVTRIEFTNGDVLDCSETATNVLVRMEEALQPQEQWPATKRGGTRK